MAYLSAELHSELDTLAELCRVAEVRSHCTMCCLSLERVSIIMHFKAANISCQRTIFVVIRSSEGSVGF